MSYFLAILSIALRSALGFEALKVGIREVNVGHGVGNPVVAGLVAD
jgi:hypothetical protein